jgi:hypothetical protein
VSVTDNDPVSVAKAPVDTSLKQVFESICVKPPSNWIPDPLKCIAVSLNGNGPNVVFAGIINLFPVENPEGVNAIVIGEALDLTKIHCVIYGNVISVSTLLDVTNGKPEIWNSATSPEPALL